jgi:hypothetical protein
VILQSEAPECGIACADGRFAVRSGSYLHTQSPLNQHREPAMPLCFIEPQDAIRVIAESVGREARRQLLGELVRLDATTVRERAVRSVLAERRSKAHVLRVLDAHAPELCSEPPLLHVLRVQAGTLADPLKRFGAAHFAEAFRSGFDEGLAVTSRFVHVVGYALAVDAPEQVDGEAVARHTSEAIAALAKGRASVAPVARELREAWSRGSGAAFADAAARARRVGESRTALLRGAELPTSVLEPTVFLVAAVGEVVAELRDSPPPSLAPARIHTAAERLLQACLDVAVR